METLSKLLAGLFIGVVAFFAIILFCFGIALLAAVPLYFLWNYCAPIWFSFLPAVWLKIGFWDIVWLSWCLGLVRNIILPSARTTAKKD